MNVHPRSAGPAVWNHNPLTANIILYDLFYIVAYSNKKQKLVLEGNETSKFVYQSLGTS